MMPQIPAQSTLPYELDEAISIIPSNKQLLTTRASLGGGQQYRISKPVISIETALKIRKIMKPRRPNVSPITSQYATSYYNNSLYKESAKLADENIFYTNRVTLKDKMNPTGSDIGRPLYFGANGEFEIPSNYEALPKRERKLLCMRQ